MKHDNNLSGKVVSGLAWKFGERITAQLVSLLVSIVLARILSPNDYGTISLVMVFITFANVFVSNGLGSALIQKKDADEIDFSSIFYINIFISIVIYGILFVAAPYISDFYNISELKEIVRILGLRIIVAAVNSIQHAYVSKHMLFKRFFWSTLFGTVLSGFVGVILAYNGFGVWALVAQYLTNTCTDTIVLWFTVKWRPKRVFSAEKAKGLASYGWKLLASGLLDTGTTQIRNLIIGKIYSPADLAFYNQGDKYPQLLVININSSIGSVLFPALSQYQEEPDRVKTMTRRAIQVSSYILWPIMLGMAAIARPFIEVILTEKWLECVPYLQIFCISYGLWPIHTANLQAINAMGRSDLFLKLEIVKKLMGLIALLSTLWISPLAMALSLIVTGMISTFINSYPNRKLLGYSYLEQLRDLLPPLLISLLMGVCVYFVQWFQLNNYLTLLIQIVLGIVIYLLGSMLIKPEGYVFLKSKILKK